MLTKEQLDNMTCFQTAFIPICQEHGRNPLIMSLWGWSFEYVDMKNLYDGLKINFSMLPNEFFHKYMNFNVVDIKKCEQILEVILMSVDTKNKKIIMEIDAFFCPWDYNYLQFHVDHYFFISQVDLKKRQFICKDWFVDKEQEYEFPIDSALEKMKGIKVVTVGDVFEEDPLIELSKGYKHPKHIEDEYNRFAERITKLNSYEELFENEEMNRCSIFIFIKKCRAYRFCICEYLQNQNIKGSQEIQEAFFELKNLWNKLNYYLMIIFIRKSIKDKNINYISKLIVEIGKKEKDTYDKVIVFLTKHAGEN